MVVAFMISPKLVSVGCYIYRLRHSAKNVNPHAQESRAHSLRVHGICAIMLRVLEVDRLAVYRDTVAAVVREHAVVVTGRDTRLRNPHNRLTRRPVAISTRIKH